MHRRARAKRPLEALANAQEHSRAQDCFPDEELQPHIVPLPPQKVDLFPFGNFVHQSSMRPAPDRNLRSRPGFPLCLALLVQVWSSPAHEKTSQLFAEKWAASTFFSPPTLLPQKGTRGPVDVFGQSHPAKATDLVTCRNCSRQVQAGMFAPHLEKCMGKGRAASRAASKRIQAQTRLD